MKRIMVMLTAALLVCVSFGQSNALADAKARLNKDESLITNPKEMTAVMQTLSSSEQKEFLAAVVEAISEWPSSESERNDLFVKNVNALLAASQKGNALTLVAEVFATVPPTALAAVNESLASGLMNRATDSNLTFNDDDYINKICKPVMEAVNNRVAGENNASVRSGFAALMLIRGSNSESGNESYDKIMSAVVDSLPDKVQNEAKTDWFPSALGQGGQEKSYAPMLEYEDTDVGGPVNDDNTVAGQATQQSASKDKESEGDSQNKSESLLAIRVASAQNLDTLLADIVGANTDPSASADAANPVVDAVQNPSNFELPFGNGDGGEDTSSVIEEVIGYQNQTTKE